MRERESECAYAKDGVCVRERESERECVREIVCEREGVPDRILARSSSVTLSTKPSFSFALLCTTSLERHDKSSI